MNSDMVELQQRILREYDSAVQSEYDSIFEYMAENSSQPSGTATRESLKDHRHSDETSINKLSTTALPLFRCFPESNQEVALVGNNTGATFSPEYYLVGEGRSLVENGVTLADDRVETYHPEEMAAVSKNYLPNYFFNSQNDWDRDIRTIRNNSPPLTSGNEMSDSEYLFERKTVDCKEPLPEQEAIPTNTGFFDEIYYTNACKAPSTDTTELAFNTSKFQGHLYEELEVLDPSLIIMAGHLGWRFFLRSVRSSEQEIERLDDGPIVEKYFERDGQEKDLARHGIYKYGDWVIATISHPGIFRTNDTETIINATKEAF